jgi:hypothetical protein
LQKIAKNLLLLQDGLTIFYVNDHPRSGWLELLPKKQKHISASNVALSSSTLFLGKEKSTFFGGRFFSPMPRPLAIYFPVQAARPGWRVGDGHPNSVRPHRRRPGR